MLDAKGSRKQSCTALARAHAFVNEARANVLEEGVNGFLTRFAQSEDREEAELPVGELLSNSVGLS